MDFKTAWDPDNARGDWVLGGPVADGISELETSMLISIFTDRLAAVDDRIPDGTDNPRGWWGDDANPEDSPETAARQIGSHLWLLDREKQAGQILQRAYDYIRDALQWLIDDGVVTRFDIDVRWVRRSFLGARVTAHKPQGATVSVALKLPGMESTDALFKTKLDGPSVHGERRYRVGAAQRASAFALFKCQGVG